VLIVIVWVMCTVGICGGPRVVNSGEDGFYSVAGPCNLVFPRDHGPHPGYRTEWWYYTGNVQSGMGERYGFQLTFFRRQIAPPEAESAWPKPSSAWRTTQLYLAHAALSDLTTQRYYHRELSARGALGLAGAYRDSDRTTVFLKNWSVVITPSAHTLKVIADDFALDLTARPLKKPIVHGDAGYSRKGRQRESASCYYSFTRLETEGTLTVRDKTVNVRGLSWMDQEFSTALLEENLTGWDWFSLQFDDGRELMVYFLRQKDGSISPASSGTWVAVSGTTTHISHDNLGLKVLDTWESPHSGGVYPSRWHLTVTEPSMDLVIESNLADQEMQSPGSTGVTYWEGSVSARGTAAGTPIEGKGYVEMTGYATPLDVPM
jgi:predicted secreted hydrolase